MMDDLSQVARIRRDWMAHVTPPPGLVPGMSRWPEAIVTIAAGAAENVGKSFTA
jgi:hypothetical protein